MRVNDRWYFRAVRDSKTSDRNAGRLFNNEEYITTLALIDMQQKQKNKCYYCQKFMDWISRRGINGLTVERLNNDLPHHTTNCVLACKSCNSKKLTRAQGLLKRSLHLAYHYIYDFDMPQTQRRCSFVT